MKYFIALLLFLVAASSQAQITLEHTYSNIHRDFSIVNVDSGMAKYIDYNRSDSIYIYNLDHSIDRTIIVPISSNTNGFELKYISKKLFNTDDAYEYLIEDHGASQLRVFKENGDLLFSCDSCGLHSETNSMQQATDYSASIIGTERGVKMLVEHFGTKGELYITIHGLPGKLPGGTERSGVNSPTIISGNSLPTSAYPNPSNGQMRIEYKLPEGVTTGEIVITSADGIEVKRYRVGNIFNDLLIGKSDLASGTYLYKLVTDKGESEVKKLVVLR